MDYAIFQTKNEKVSLLEKPINTLYGLIDHIHVKIKQFLPLSRNIFEAYKKIIFDIYIKIETDFINLKKKLTIKQRFVVEDILTKLIEIIPE